VPLQLLDKERLVVAAKSRLYQGRYPRAIPLCYRSNKHKAMLARHVGNVIYCFLTLSRGFVANCRNILAATQQFVQRLAGMSKHVLFNKPCGVLSQFTDKSNVGSSRATLSDFIDVPGVYAAGRLDRDSEGLLFLTDDGALQHRISDPKHKFPKTYWVQIEGVPDDAALHALSSGVVLKDGKTKPAKVRAIPTPGELWPRTPPIRVRKSIPDSWLELTIAEGRNRQIRRMTAAVGLPTLRLIRCRIADWSIDGLKSGAWRHV